VSPTVSHFKQFSEIPGPPAYLHSVVALEESLYKANDLDHLSQAIQLILCHTLLIFAALLTFRVRPRLGSLLVRFSSGFLCLPTKCFGWSGQLGMFISWHHQRNPRSWYTSTFGYSFGKNIYMFMTAFLVINHWW